MKWIRYVIFIIWFATYSTSDDIPSDTNEIDPKDTVKKLDPAIRQALLRAIDNLEKRVAEEEEYEDEELAAGNDEGLDESPKSRHDLIKSLLDIVSTEKNLIGSLNGTSELSELIEKTAIRVSNQHLTRAIPSEITNDISNGIQNSTTKRPYVATRRRTSTEPTTTTTKKPAPTHNADGENIEVVEKQDIKIFEAPLITAFTVKQDGKGTEKQVIPIFEPPPLPAQTAPGHTGPAIDSTNKHSTSVLLPTPNPPQSFLTNQISNQQVPSQDVSQQILKNQSLPITEKVPFNPSQSAQSLFPVQQSLPLNPVNPSQSHSINEFLLERQRQLEQQILQLQIQARRQQEQILLQQQLLLEQQRKQFLNSDTTNQIIAPKLTKVDNSVRPSLEVVSSVTQTPRFEYSVEQQLPVRESANFRHDFFGPIAGLHRTSFQIQPSNQIPFNPSSQFSQPALPVPLEISTFQHLPQRSFQPFNLLPPPGPLNPNHSIGKIPQSDQNSQKTRHFRQETGTGNFFIHEPLRPPPFGATSTFSLNPFQFQNANFNGQFSGNF